VKINFLNFLLAVGALALTSCSSMKTKAAESGRPAIKNLSARKFSETIRADYLLFLPKGYSSTSTNRWPLILFLHGSGERGTNVWKTATHGPTKYIEKNPDFPFILVTPLCPSGQKWPDDMVLGLLDKVIAEQMVDTNRIYVTGLSMGGYGAWSLATTFPERFAAVAPICGGEGTIGAVLSQMDKAKASAFKNLSIWAFHGAKDNVVPVGESERMVNFLKKCGVKEIKLTIYPEAMHNSWTETYNNPKLYDWFLQHKLKPVK
jgi:predicted peptidase